MRDKKYVGTTNTMSTATTSSNPNSGSVSVVSNEETASYYSIQSISPDNSTYLNGNNSSDSNSATYPNDGFEHDLSLIYSSGFYDNNGYFYVNRKFLMKKMNVRISNCSLNDVVYKIQNTRLLLFHFT